MYNKEIRNLIKNINIKQIKKLNIVLEGGALNGGYLLGIVLFIKELEHQKKLKVNKISGTSIGALVGLTYFLNKLNLSQTIIKTTRLCLKKKKNLSCLRDIIEKITDNITTKQLKLLTNRFYVTYFDITLNKQIIQYKYDTKEQLINTIFKACYLPFVIDGNHSYTEKNNSFVDGGMPFLFTPSKNKKHRVLYLCITPISKVRNIISFRKDNNLQGRILEGVLDIYYFFLYNVNTKYCSYIDNWKPLDFCTYRLKQLVLLISIIIINLIVNIYSKISPYLNRYRIYKHFTKFLIASTSDLISHYCL
mgnify:CR=1 FL=1